MNRYTKALQTLNPKLPKEDWTLAARRKVRALKENMTTGNVFINTVPAAGEDTDLVEVDTDNADVFVASQDQLEGGTDYAPMVGTEIKNSGSGTGTDGGFNVGTHLAFDGVDGDAYNYRWATLAAVDSTNFDEMAITAIRGNDTNGGEDPDEANEELEVWYQIVGKTTQDRFLPMDYKNDGVTQDTSYSSTIIPVGSGSGELREWKLRIPAWARAENTKFMLYQRTSSGKGWDNYGVTKVAYRRVTPITVVVSLDSPEASSFIRVGSDPGKPTSPKKRKKNVNDMLKASGQYTDKKFGKDFPGSKAEPVGTQSQVQVQDYREYKKEVEAQEKEAGKKTLTTFQKDKEAKEVSVAQQQKIAAEKKQVQYDKAAVKEVEREVKDSKEIEKFVKAIPEEEIERIIEQEPMKIPKGIPGFDFVKGKIADAVINTIATVTQPIMKAKTASNTLNTYDDFLGKLAKNKNTEGSSYDNPMNIEKQITKGDMAALQKTVNSKAFQDSINFLKTNLEKPEKKMTGQFKGKTNHDLTRESAQGTLNQLIKNTIHDNFGLDNSLHNNVQVDLDHLLDTGKTRLTKEYTFKPGNSVGEAEGTWYGKAIENVLGIPLDTLSTGKSAFAGAIAAKIGLGNAEQYGGAYKAPGMFMELEIPEEQLDAKQEKQPSAEEKKNTLSSMVGFGDEEEVETTTDKYGRVYEIQPEVYNDKGELVAPEGKTDVTPGETLSDDDIKALKDQGITDAQIKRVMDAGGAKDLKALAAGDVYSNTADGKINSIVSRSQGKIENISDSDLQYLMDKGYPIDDWLYGGKTGSPVGDLIGLGLVAGAIKLALPLLLKAGGSLVNLVKSEWGMRAITDAAYKTFETTGKMPPWYHWAAHKLLPQPILNTFAKITGTEAAKSILYTKGTAAGSALWRTLQATGAAATIQKLMFDGKTDQANDIIQKEWVKQTDEKIDKMSNKQVSGEIDKMWKANPKEVEKKFMTVLNTDSEYKNYQREYDRLNTDYVDQYAKYDEIKATIEPLEIARREAYVAYNSVKWGGYTDQDPNSKTYNKWIDTPQPEYSEKERFERAGVSYASYEAAVKTAGTLDFNDIFNDKATTGLAGKVVKIGSRLKELEKNLAGPGRRMTGDKAQYDKWVEAEANYKSVLAEFEAAFNQWEKAASKASDIFNSVGEKGDQVHAELEKAYDEATALYQEAEKGTDDQMDLIRKTYEELGNLDPSDILERIDKKFLKDTNLDAIEKAMSNAPNESFKPEKQKEFKIASGTSDAYWDKLIKSIEAQTPVKSEKDVGDPYTGTGRGRGMGDRGSTLKTPKQKEQEKQEREWGVGGADAATVAAEKSKKKKYQIASYLPQGNVIIEKSFNEPHSQVHKLKAPKAVFRYPGKPSPDGFPDNPPPKQVNGWHPEYGKRANRFDKLDPISAKAMPKQGDPEIDAKVVAAKKKRVKLVLRKKNPA